MNKRTFLKNSTTIAIVVILTGMLRPTSCRGQKPIDLNDCKTVNSIMNDTAITNFLRLRIERFDRCVFSNGFGTSLLNIGCKSFDIGSRRCEVLDSAEVATHGYSPNLIVYIYAIEKEKHHILLALEWMETGAEFDVSNGSNGYIVKLVSIDRLD